MGEEAEEGGDIAEIDEIVLVGGDRLAVIAVVPPLALVAVADAIEWIAVAIETVVRLDNYGLLFINFKYQLHVPCDGSFGLVCRYGYCWLVLLPK